jgi:hypothetical protein
MFPNLYGKYGHSLLNNIWDQSFQLILGKSIEWISLVNSANHTSAKRIRYSPKTRSSGWVREIFPFWEQKKSQFNLCLVAKIIHDETL